MSADSVHGSIAKKINASGDLYDLDDYINAIKISRKRLETYLIIHSEVIIFKSELKSIFPKQYNISNLKVVEFRRGQNKLFVKTDYADQTFTELNVLKTSLVSDIYRSTKARKDMLIDLEKRDSPRGISIEKKNYLLKIVVFESSIILQKFTRK